jgi:hypothetical protein
MSRSYPNLKIVWPFWLAMITSIEILAAGLIIASAPLVLAAIIFGGPYLIASYFEDSLVVKLHGITVEKEYLYFEHLLIIGADIIAAMNQLMNPVIADSLKISGFPEGDPEKGFLIRIKEKGKFCKIKLIKSESDPKSSELKIVYYQKGRYTLIATPKFLEWKTEKSSVLQGVFSRLEREKHYEVKPIISLTNRSQDSYIDEAVKDIQQGYFATFKTFSMQERLKIIALVALIGATIVLFLVGATIEAIGYAVFDIVIVIYDVLDISKKRSNW